MRLPHEIAPAPQHRARIDRLLVDERLGWHRRIEGDGFGPSLGKQQRTRRVAHFAFSTHLEAVEADPVHIGNGRTLDDPDTHHSRSVEPEQCWCHVDVRNNSKLASRERITRSTLVRRAKS
jgi:hypothetical protein